MKTLSWRAVLVSLTVCALPFAAEAQQAGCSAELSNAAYLQDANPEDVRLSCDLVRADLIRNRAATLYGAGTNSLVEIIDTASPSGAAYVYDVVADGANLRLDARSVPDGRGYRCRLQTQLPDDTANALSILLAKAGDPELPAYGPRETVTLNPDGSRSLRLLIDGHDIITRAETAVGARNFSRHADSDDPVSRINNLVIGVANVSSSWVCKSS